MRRQGRGWCPTVMMEMAPSEGAVARARGGLHHGHHWGWGSRAKEEGLCDRRACFRADRADRGGWVRRGLPANAALAESCRAAELAMAYLSCVCVRGR